MTKTKLKQVLESIYYSTVSLRIGEMNRHHAVPPPRPHLHQQPQFQQPLDVIAGVMTDREQPIGDGELPIDGDSQQQRWRSLMRHWPVIVYVIFAVSLLLNATVVGVVWSQWRADCSTAQSRCPPHYVSQAAVAQQIGEKRGKNIDDWESLSPQHRSRFQYDAPNGTVTVRDNGIYLIYSSVSFRAHRGGEDKKEVFRHEILEVKGNSSGELLHNVVEKQCRSTDAACHASVLVSTLWLKAGYTIYVDAAPKPLLNTSDAHFGIVLISR